jgi:hypothetical protein
MQRDRVRPIRGGLLLASVIVLAGLGAWLAPLVPRISDDSPGPTVVGPPSQASASSPASGEPGEGVAFLSRPASDPIVRRGGSSVVIENVSIRGGTVDAPEGIGISIRDVHGSITIRDVDLADLIGGIYIDNSSGTLLIENVRSRNVGDGTIGHGRSNHIQLAESSFSGAIRHNRFLGGRTEDMLSTWRSGGAGEGEELIIEHNRFQGLLSDTPTARAWTSASGTGVIVSDGPGSPKNGWIIVRNNTFLNPGQVAIQHIDGEGIQTLGNVIFSEQHENANNPMTSWAGNPRGMVRDNRYCWTKPDGTMAAPWFGGYGQLVTANNVEDCSIDPAALTIALP